MKSSLRILFILSLLIVTTACRQKPLEIGFVGPLSGRYSDMGTEARNGALLAVDEWNKADKKNRPPLILTPQDDKNSTETARNIVQEFLKNGVEIIIGPMTSTLSLGVVDLIENNEAIMISPTASTTELSGLEDGFYRLVEAYTQEGQHLSRYASDDLGLTRLGVVYDKDNAVYSEGWLESLVKDFKQRGGTLVSTVVLDLDQKDSHYEGARKLLSADPEVVVLALPGLDAGLISQQIALMGGDVQLMLSTWAKDGDLLPYGGEAVEGAFYTEMFRDDSNQAFYVQFKSLFQERFGYEPGFAAALGYESVLLIEDVLKQKSRGQSYREALNSIQTLTGLQGNISIDPFGDVVREHHNGIIQEGEFIYLEK